MNANARVHYRHHFPNRFCSTIWGANRIQQCMMTARKNYDVVCIHSTCPTQYTQCACGFARLISMRWFLEQFRSIWLQPTNCRIVVILFDFLNNVDRSICDWRHCIFEDQSHNIFQQQLKFRRRFQTLFARRCFCFSLICKQMRNVWTQFWYWNVSVIGHKTTTE